MLLPARSHDAPPSEQDGCPYRFTFYRDYERSHVDSPFGLQLLPPPPNSLSGWGTRICPSARPGPQRVAPGHDLGANSTRCAPAPT